MDKRIDVSNESLLKANEQAVIAVGQKIEKHGKKCYISHHESLGIIAEEYKELIDACQSNDPAEVASELMDIAAACIFAVASMFEIEEFLKKEEK